MMAAVSILSRTINASADNRRNLERVARLQSDVSSGTRVRQLSDDPVAGRRALALRATQVRGDGYREHADRALASAAVTDGVYAEMVSIFDAAKAIAVEGVTATQDAASRAALARSVEATFDRLVEITNTSHEGRYIFAGTDVRQRPFDVTEGDGVLYRGSLDDTRALIGPGVAMTTERNGYDLFMGEDDVFSALTNLRDALVNDDVDAIDDSLTQLDDAHQRVVGAQGELGSRIQRLEGARTRLEEADVQLRRLISEQVDTDLAATIQELQSAQVALEAGLQTAARVLQPSLLDFL
ncbi:MAG: flagellin N-terminal helical domain-containing protein [Planctomycetota bacterium]|jgi:flagellar hook-associated protein 3 FlgL